MSDQRIRIVEGSDYRSNAGLILVVSNFRAIFTID